MSRYNEATKEMVDLVEKVRKEYFSDYTCKVKILMDTKKRVSKGAITFASISKARDLVRYLSADEFNPDGYDYIMFLDKNIFDNITEEDKIRIIRHEWRHVYHDPEKSDPWKLLDHDVQDFKEELKLNKDDMFWGDRVYQVAQTIYEE